MRNKTLIIGVVWLVFLTVFSGCKSSSYELQILMNNQPVRVFSLKEIKKMPAESFIVEGKIESGPSISTLLRYAGIQNYAKISIMNEAFELFELSAEQNMDNFILDITNRGNVKLASKNIAKKDWMKDITTIAASSNP